MDQPINSFGSIVRRPSAFLPLAMSLTALALVLGRIALFGAAREADEGATAHLWQLLMAGQMPRTGILRDQVAAPGSKADAMCTCPAGWSCARFHGPRLASELVNDSQ